MSVDFVRIENNRAHTDKQTLFACSHVSRSWASLTLRHRFYAISLFARTGHPQEHSIRKRCFLQDFVRSSLFSAVKPYIQRLTLRWGITQAYPYIGADLTQHLSFFPALRSLKLRGLLSQRIQPPSPLASIILESLIVEGWVCHGHAHDPRVLCDLLRCFHSVGELQLEDIREWLPVSDYSSARDSRPRISSFVLRDSTCPHTICDVLRDISTQEQPLRRLDIRALSSADAQGGIELMKAFVDTVEDFKCTILSASIYTALIPPFDFSTPRHLQSLAVAVVFPLSRIRRAHSFAGGENPVRTSPLGRAISSLETLRPRTRTTRSPLELLDIQLVPDRQLSNKVQTAGALLDVLRRNDAAARAFEAAVIGLLREGCVQHVRVGVYGAPPASGLGEGCRHACEDELADVFPALRRLGILMGA